MGRRCCLFGVVLADSSIFTRGPAHILVDQPGFCQLAVFVVGVILDWMVGSSSGNIMNRVSGRGCFRLMLFLFLGSSVCLLGQQRLRKGILDYFGLVGIALWAVGVAGLPVYILVVRSPGCHIDLPTLGSPH